MPQGIKLVSVNIEMNRHLDAVLSFLTKERPDVVCFQELLQRDVEHFARVLGLRARFEPMATLKSPMFEKELQGSPFGLAILSRYPAAYDVEYYAGNNTSLPSLVEGYEGNKFFLRATFEKDNKVYRAGTTHFTWTQDGNASDEQRRDIDAFLTILDACPDLFFCGDFNAPRGGEIWGKLAERYTDNIPAAYRSSLDPVLHRAGHLKHVVDGLFSTPEYRVSAVRLVEGVSDHKAVVGTIMRT